MLPNGVAGSREILWVRGVERKHFVVARNHSARSDLFTQLRCFSRIQIARHAALWRAAVDWQQRDIYLVALQQLCQAVIEQSVTAVIDRPRDETHDIADKFRPQLIMLRGNRRDLNWSGNRRLADLQ